MGVINMEKITLNEIREKYLAFFESKGHLCLPSFSLVPEHDKSLLVINAGMAPLKPYFTGQAVPPHSRLVTCQRCLRTIDIEIVGKTARHFTFFEMLGNFSFGDYFKDEIIPWAWEFVTQELKIPVDKLFVSVYEEDDEAHDIWRDKVGIPAERIFRLGKKDNFWELNTGPCGPCSEIYFDRGAKHGMDDFVASIDADEDRYVEIWNLVFTQFNKSEDGTYSELKTKNIDTGMGLDRVAMVMQGVDNMFDIDAMVAIRDEVCAISGVKYGADAKKDLSLRIISDHCRAVTFMIADGILPSNEGRGYVLRRLLRRGLRHGRLLGIIDGFMVRLSKVVVGIFADAYPQLREKADYTYTLIQQEEQRFFETLDSGVEQLRKFVAELKAAGKTMLGGADAFKLYDTFGFPLELTIEILEEEGMNADETGFAEEMERQRSRARAAREDAGFTGHADKYAEMNLSPVEFVGFTHDAVSDATVLYVDENVIITDKTPCYAERGGQKADVAMITAENGTAIVTDCVVAGNQVAHVCKERSGQIKAGDKVAIVIDTARRLEIARNHTATHLLHHFLRQVLGEHVQQAGSLVSHDRLRFDFAHFAPVTPEQLAQVENAVNAAVLSGLQVCATEMSMADAKAKGAIALFGEKYGDNVRVVSIGDDIAELCGGTHLVNAAQIGSLKILSENGISAGVRRIEAVVGNAALTHYAATEAKLAEVAAFLKTQPDNVLKRVEQLAAAAKDAERKLAKARQADANAVVDEILSAKEQFGGITLASAILPDMDADGLRNLSDTLIERLGSGVVLLVGLSDDKANLLARATDDAVKAGVHCGNLVKAAAQAAGGGGGGRPNMAQAGIKDASKAQDAINAAKKQLQ